MLRWHLLRAAAVALRFLSTPFLLVGWFATPILQASAWCEDRAREWDPRLWARGGDRRPETPEDDR
ncbi:hypothetical protein [Methylobacterium planeticum]|uniref:Uncharacterized protein n=1 Tax=Methylobacterium planeticum TaxID=2615211 RepID=A0A6N6MHC2_9HYPH|nr:hypothetical protein [Methylobacterium planeticum]KAB1068879.1 hypothetical protein F6X51_26105 [Methylobacterium planeticum]